MMKFIFLIFAILFALVIWITKKELKFLEDEYEKEIKQLKNENKALRYEIEDCKDKETKTRRICDWDKKTEIELANKKFNEFKTDIESVLRNYGNPVIAIDNVRRIIRKNNTQKNKESSNNLAEDR